MGNLIINRMPARKVTRIIDNSSIYISRRVQEDDNGYGPIGEVSWMAQDEDDPVAYAGPYARLWEAREYAVRWALGMFN